MTCGFSFHMFRSFPTRELIALTKDSLGMTITLLSTSLTIGRFGRPFMFARTMISQPELRKFPACMHVDEQSRVVLIEVV